MLYFPLLRSKLFCLQEGSFCPYPPNYKILVLWLPTYPPSVHPWFWLVTEIYINRSEHGSTASEVVLPRSEEQVTATMTIIHESSLTGKGLGGIHSHQFILWLLATRHIILQYRPIMSIYGKHSKQAGGVKKWIVIYDVVHDQTAKDSWIMWSWRRLWQTHIVLNSNVPECRFGQRPFWEPSDVRFPLRCC